MFMIVVINVPPRDPVGGDLRYYPKAQALAALSLSSGSCIIIIIVMVISYDVNELMVDCYDYLRRRFPFSF